MAVRIKSFAELTFAYYLASKQEISFVLMPFLCGDACGYLTMISYCHFVLLYKRVFLYAQELGKDMLLTQLVHLTNEIIGLLSEVYLSPFVY